MVFSLKLDCQKLPTFESGQSREVGNLTPASSTPAEITGLAACLLRPDLRTEKAVDIYETSEGRRDARNQSAACAFEDSCKPCLVPEAGSFVFRGCLEIFKNLLIARLNQSLY